MPPAKPSDSSAPDSPTADVDLPPTAPATHADLEVARRILDGDEAAFAGLVEKHHQSLLRVSQMFVSSKAVGEEVVQETWLAVLEGLKRFEGRSSLRTWIFRILANRSRSRAVREARSVPMSAIDKGDGETIGTVDPSRFNTRGGWVAPPRRWDDDTPEKLLNDAQSRRIVEGAIAELPPGPRAVITLRDVKGWTSEEVCNALEISQTNQRVLLHRARTRIRAVLERYLDES